ncbi:MAG TPA: hypothetical protein VN323_09735 [Candidatus Dormibacteraeota bacterium]|jgi:hypothetical protein|nr:hypothetical protein [Candidatus Dormibacteraeota bacterium]
MNHKFIPILIVASMVFTIGLTAAHAPAQQPDLRTFLIGKWHQEYGPYVTESVLTAGGTYTSITIQPGTAYRLYVQGRWDVRYGNQLWMEWENWEPSNLRKPLPEGTLVQPIDANHFRSKFGVVTRMR